RWRGESLSGWLGGMAGEIGAIRRSLKAKHFDIALDPQGLIKSGVIAWLTSAPVRIGLARVACREGMNTLFTTHRVDSPDGHIVRKNLSLLTPLGIVVGSPDFGIRVSHEAEARVASLLKEAGLGPGDRLVGIHPGVGHPRKRWDPDRYAQVGDRLQEGEGARVILTAGPGEDALVSHVASRMRTSPVVIPLLRAAELAALLSRYDLLIAGDTGPLHLAAALGCHTVAIYGPSDPVRVAPVGKGHQVLKKACACGWTPELHFNRRCRDVPCLGAITVDEVLAAAVKSFVPA
ncbi:MAG: glycosyltransferase family 9 protein, partial [Candidatus Methylomirabilis sp.]